MNELVYDKYTHLLNLLYNNCTGYVCVQVQIATASPRARALLGLAGHFLLDRGDVGGEEDGADILDVVVGIVG